jgi:hypothetical protein
VRCSEARQAFEQHIVNIIDKFLHSQSLLAITALQNTMFTNR